MYRKQLVKIKDRLFLRHYEMCWILNLSHYLLTAEMDKPENRNLFCTMGTRRRYYKNRIMEKFQLTEEQIESVINRKIIEEKEKYNETHNKENDSSTCPERTILECNKTGKQKRRKDKS